MPEVFFNGPAGRIEGRYTESSNRKAPVALILHPHPLYGGTMNNKVVYSLYQTLVQNDFTVLRINFRGVGRSQGQFDNGIGEMIDAATALDWLQLNNPTSTLNLIAGFSFGAWIAMLLIMRRPEIKRFIAVSPPVNKYDFSFLTPCPLPGLIVQGDLDSIVSEVTVLDLVNRLSKQKHIKIDYKVINGADHFFRKKEEELIKTVDEYLKTVFHTSSLEDNIEASEESIKDTKSQKVFLY